MASPTATDLRTLPNWARVAFAARCARLAWAPADPGTVVERAIELAERAAARAMPIASAALEETIAALDAAVEARAQEAQLAAARARRVGTIPVPGWPSMLLDGSNQAADRALLAGSDFAVAARSARAALRAAAEPEQSAEHAATAVAAALQLANWASGLVLDDFRRLAVEAARQRWDDDSPVASAIFRPVDQKPPTRHATQPPAPTLASGRVAARPEPQPLAQGSDGTAPMAEPATASGGTLAIVAALAGLGALALGWLAKTSRSGPVGSSDATSEPENASDPEP
jgi:hypothetical protein